METNSKDNLSEDLASLDAVVREYNFQDDYERFTDMLINAYRTGRLVVIPPEPDRFSVIAAETTLEAKQRRQKALDWLFADSGDLE